MKNKALNGLVAVVFGIIFSHEIIVGVGLIIYGLWLAINILKEKENVKKSNRIMSIVTLVLGIIGILSIIFIATLSSSNKEISNWINVVSPDGKLSVDLPNSFEFVDTPNGYVGQLKDQNNKVGYTVKYQDYKDTFLKLNIEELSPTAKNSFLQGLADDIKKVPGYDISNFSTQFINVKGYDAIKYTGFISGNDGNSNLEGYIILVGKSSYSISVLYVTGSNNEIDRVLSSLVIK